MTNYLVPTHLKFLVALDLMGLYKLLALFDSLQKYQIILSLISEDRTRLVQPLIVLINKLERSIKQNNKRFYQASYTRL